MRPSTSFATGLVLFVGNSLAVPTARTEQCMTTDEASVVASKFGELIASYTTDLASAILDPYFHDYSESVNSLINSCPQGSAALSIPLAGPTFGSRAMFELGQGQQSPIDFELLNLWSSCTSVTIRWLTTNTANGTDVKPVIGLIVMETIKANATSKYPWLIRNVFSEFDSGAWLQNLQAAHICSGSTDPVPDPPSPSGVSSSPSPTSSPVPAGVAADDPPDVVEHERMG